MLRLPLAIPESHPPPHACAAYSTMMEMPLEAPVAAGGAHGCKPPLAIGGSCAARAPSRDVDSFPSEALCASPTCPSLKANATPSTLPPPSAAAAFVHVAAAGCHDTAEASTTTAPARAARTAHCREKIPGGEEDSYCLRALQLLLSDILGVVAMLRPAGSSALPRGVAAAVARARKAAQVALLSRERTSRANSISNSATIAAALAAAANTAAIVIEQRNPQFAFHQFTVLAASSFQQVAPYVTNYLQELLKVLEQRRPLLRLLRAREAKGHCESEGKATTATASSPPPEVETDNLKLLLQVFLAYCPASMLDSVCDKLAAAYAEALLGETSLLLLLQGSLASASASAEEQAAAAGEGEGGGRGVSGDLFGGKGTQGAEISAAEQGGSALVAPSETAASVVSPTPPTSLEGSAKLSQSLARPLNDAVAVSVAALLDQRCFLRRLASSIDWSFLASESAAAAAASARARAIPRTADAAGTEAMPDAVAADSSSSSHAIKTARRRSHQALEDSALTVALRDAYTSASCLYDTEMMPPAPPDDAPRERACKTSAAAVPCAQPADTGEARLRLREFSVAAARRRRQTLRTLQRLATRRSARRTAFLRGALSREEGLQA
ncbi:hypothetical protein cyc_07540 [Cyclospora cayetanensis]|uniref:Uncharacterized protein n=1 Tax=Cyclospora cayetanensis TaxID=88456 RepID=A0A1D3CZ59_9EIME|nr:hypothetical protein cyc_07540 [Cyclospora cayetanensis]